MVKFSKILSFFLLLCILLEPIYANTGYISSNDPIRPNADVYVDSQYPNSNRVELSYLEVGYHNFTLQNYSQISYYLFDFSSFSCSGQLQFDVYASSYNTITLGLHEVYNTTWFANSMTWNNKPDFNHTIIDSVTFNSTKYIYFNLSSIKQVETSYAIVAETGTSFPAKIESLKVNDHPPLLGCSLSNYISSTSSSTIPASTTVTSTIPNTTTITSTKSNHSGSIPGFELDSILILMTFTIIKFGKKQKRKK